MEYQGVKGKRLSFKSSKDPKRSKGGKSPSKHRSKKQHRADKESECQRVAGWVPVSSLSDLEGPLSIFFRDEYVHIFSLPPKEETQALADTSEQPPAFYAIEDASLAEAEPSGVEQVFVGRKSVPTAGPADAEGKMYSLKSCTGKYLSASRHGKVMCSAPAIGPLEMWTPLLLPDRGDGAVAFMISPPGTTGDRFLGAEPQDREHSTSTQRRIAANANADATGFCQVFTVKCQAALQRKRRAAADADDELDTDKLSGDVASDEAKQAKRFQSFQGGRVHLSKRSSAELDEARESGKYREGLLDRREKMKADRYCK
ncbi:hypothetical protein GQ54DRAFT_308312 [Martensiomyces pterosporus]|nr:hypothetical protein GQ54DRAFT_308312 [Martensiomyces pterosporus]